ncbi:general stress protein [Sporosarcina sp. FSL K6-2383]|uniref:general stress protein n=1 Tax=Sporosarcina sp. FSL K6-2383 TaxID=2921556 RepID=UPI00315B0282
MDDKKYVGTFHSIDTVLYKIIEMKAQGIDESNMYAVTIEEDNISMLRGRSDIELLGTADDDWLNRFTLFLKGEESVLDAFSSMGFSEQQSRHYYDEVKNGGVALFIENGVSKSHLSEQKSDNPRSVVEEMDSSTDRSISRGALEGQDENQQIVNNDPTVPRLNTRNL